ncbi:tyrosine-protein phosphatase non-receptor type 23 [Linepithema humile]|uniref:tyrosine-protein phosphatase non-receptor type 23 n=1 Tax=Linepithema humile TaxID=83485 RepID=UPI0006239C79|nr:PREDICTED: tyrosine-protein phosphatase non-receptor type 23 [Linepithema humile]XP_012225665.1 PREDICTED: tyrosine-protein phosphatase non-receptor type 23 [Linepithema humile]XP_012225667.1 PREDICTED: tyrosine-protein phosphatase non-receptor type 23 [Linepithema humile]
MEAVPRLPMIWFQVKVSPEPTTFGPKLKQYIRDFYNEDPESYNNEIHQLESLRSMAVRPPVDMAGCVLLKKYYCQLHFLQSRFPMGKDGPAAVTFTWRDTYANMVCSLANIRFEMISILYNIGAIHSQLGARTERNSADGMKMACTHFQCAAWAFEHLKNSYPQPSGVDLAPELMTFMHQLCLAQAQECILEKSMLDNRKPTIVAKVAKQIVDYFTMALNTLEQGGSEDGTAVSDTVGTKIYKSWKRYVKFKKAYHSAVTYLYQGLAAEEQRKMGERVAFYNAALASLNEAHAIYDFANVKEEKAAVEESLTFTNDVIEGKRKAAKNENEFIYHEEVPEKETLPTVKGASLVKGISFNISDPEVSGQDIFARLVPMKVHEASSLYSEEKAKILRSVGAKVEEKDQYLNTFLTSLKLEHLNLWDPDIQTSDWECLPLPEELVERCAALNAKQHVIQDLIDIMGKLSETSQDVERVLKDISKLLLEEEQKEKKYQDAVGKRPPSIVATDLTREAKKYEEAHNKASESNQALHKAITMHVKNLKVLSQPLADLMAQIPSPTTYLLDQSSEKSQNAKEIEKMHTKELKRILSKVDEMRMQRLDLHTKLRDQIAQDDLTRLLVTATSESASLDRLFADQLSKHQSLVNLIEQNLAAQDNILTALTDVYAQTANVRKNVEEILKRREIMISSLINSYDAYEDLLAKSSKGLEFYRKLEINVAKLLQRVKSTCRVQEEEREQILAQDSKNTYEKTDATIPSTYDQGRTRSNNGLKLKDYLNNRAEGSSTGYQNPYYNFYKGHAATMPIDSTSKSLATDMADKNLIQSPSAIPGSASEIPSSSVKSSQHYYPATYNPADYRTNSPYAYGTQNYYENPIVSNTLNQNYLPTTNTNTTNVYQQPALSTPTANASNSNAQYPASSYVPNGQTLLAATTGQDKFRGVSHSNYNVSNTALQYDAYQSPTGYSSYNVATPYVPNQEAAAAAINSGTTEVPSQVQPVTQMPVSTIGVTISSTSSTDVQGQTYSIAQQAQQYNNQQKTTLGQEISHGDQNSIGSQQALSTTDNTLTQNYSLPPAGHPDMTYPQNYQNAAYYNPAENQRISYTHNTYDTATVVPPTQYMQSPQPNASNQPVHSITSTSEAPTSYPSNLHSVNPVQYSQQTNTEQSTQSYTDKTYAAYGTQVQMNAVAQNYPSTYQNYHNAAGVSYQQTNMLPGDTSNTYAYLNSSGGSEIIQSHTKPTTTVQSYSQSYQYSQQAPYSGYVQYPNYSQGQNYAYMQNTHGTNTMTYTYNPVSQAQVYSYASNPQGAQTSQALEATVPVTSTDVAAGNVYQQQETNARYTNAGNNTVSQTPSSQYSQVYQSQTGNDTYYTMPYGLQMQGQAGSVTKSESHTNYNQTYMQAVNSGTNTTTSANPMKLTTKSDELKSNVDLLADLDITINHAPLVPEVRPLSTVQKKEETVTNNTAEDDKTEKIDQDNPHKTEQEATVSTEDKSDHENLQIVWDTWYNDVQPKKDPLGEPAALQKFVNDVEKYEKFVDSLLVKTLSGATNLDIKWKEVQDFEEREDGKQSSTVALAHSSENRTVDCIPYDTTRVQISSSDISSYINASHIMEITQWIPTAFIITQTPLPDKLDVFWAMIWEQESEVIACLASNAQLNGELYWPISEDSNLDVGSFTISLKKIVNHTTYIQRTLSIQHNKKKSEKVVVHMQFLTWPSNGFPSSPGALLAFSSDVMTEQALRRCSPKPVVVHCLDGGSLSSLFLVAATTVCHIRAGCGIVDVPLVFKGLAKCRKQVVNKESLLFAYRLVLYHAQDILMKRGILSSTRSTFENFDGFKGNKEKGSKKSIQCHPSDDFLHNLGVGMHRSDSEQGKTQTTLTSDSTSSKNSTSSEKSNGGVLDPLSQLDPLWSIRR